MGDDRVADHLGAHTESQQDTDLFGVESPCFEPDRPERQQDSDDNEERGIEKRQPRRGRKRPICQWHGAESLAFFAGH